MRFGFPTADYALRGTIHPQRTKQHLLQFLSYPLRKVSEGIVIGWLRARGALIGGQTTRALLDNLEDFAELASPRAQSY